MGTHDAARPACVARLPSGRRVWPRIPVGLTLWPRLPIGRRGSS